MSNETAERGQVAAPPKPKLTWGEKRELRRKRRRVFEEVMGWILVPALIYVGYLIFMAVGGIPKEATEFASEVFSAITGGRL